MTERYRVWQSLAWEDFPGEIVAIDLQRGTYFNLAGGGVDVFRAFIEPASVDEVVAELAPRYDATPEALAEAVRGLVKDLVDRGLVVATSDVASSERASASEQPGPRLPLTGFVLNAHEDLQDLIVVDPVHDTADEGWPNRKP